MRRSSRHGTRLLLSFIGRAQPLTVVVTALAVSPIATAVEITEIVTRAASARGADVRSSPQSRYSDSLLPPMLCDVTV